jgi:hypothetical protein
MRAWSSSGIERLAQEIVGAGEDTLEAIVALRLRGDDDDRHETRRRLLFESAANVEAVASRRHEIEEHDIRRLRRAGRQHLVGGANHRHVMSFAGQQTVQEPGTDVVVIGDENRRGRCHLG